jgi:hypothetical protein
MGSCTATGPTPLECMLPQSPLLLHALHIGAPLPPPRPPHCKGCRMFLTLADPAVHMGCGHCMGCLVLRATQNRAQPATYQTPGHPPRK